MKSSETDRARIKGPQRKLPQGVCSRQSENYKAKADFFGMLSRRELPCPVRAQALRAGQAGRPLRGECRAFEGGPQTSPGPLSLCAEQTAPWPFCGLQLSPGPAVTTCVRLIPAPQHTSSCGRLSSERKRSVCFPFMWRASNTSGVHGGSLERGTGESCDWGLESKCRFLGGANLCPHTWSPQTRLGSGGPGQRSRLDSHEVVQGFITEETTASCPLLSGQRPQRKVPLCQPF